MLAFHRETRGIPLYGKGRVDIGFGERERMQDVLNSLYFRRLRKGSFGCFVVIVPERVAPVRICRTEDGIEPLPRCRSFQTYI